MLQILSSERITTLRESITRHRLLAYLVSAIALLILTYGSGIVHDYGAYLRQWQNILGGADPWLPAQDANGTIPKNAYGPIHALFAWFVQIHPLMPKLILAVMTLGTCCFAFALKTTRNAQSAAAEQLFLLYTLSPLVIISVFAFSNNDGVVGVLVLAACASRLRGAYGWTGLMLGLAALMKFYPLLFAPFFATARDGSLRLRTLLAAGGSFAVGMIFAWLRWGDTIFIPFLFGSGRASKDLSILRFLTAIKEELSIEPFVDYLHDINSVMVLAVTVLVALWGWLTRQGWEITSLMGILAILMTYKVGHQQFYVAWIAFYAFVIAASEDQKAVAVARAFTPLSVFLAVYQVQFYAMILLTGAYFEGPFFFVRVFGSLVLLGIVVWCLRRARPYLTVNPGPTVSLRL